METEWFSLGVSIITGTLAGWWYGRAKAQQTMIRALLWIIIRRIRMGIFFNSLEHAIISKAIDTVK